MTRYILIWGGGRVWVTSEKRKERFELRRCVNIRLSVEPCNADGATLSTADGSVLENIARDASGLLRVPILSVRRHCLALKAQDGVVRLIFRTVWMFRFCYLWSEGDSKFTLWLE